MDITDVMEAEQRVIQLQQEQGALLREILPQSVIEHLVATKVGWLVGWLAGWVWFGLVW